MRGNEAYVECRVLRMELPGRRRKGRPKRRFVDEVRTDMEELGLTEEDVQDYPRW